jgi:hypothetical protein
VVAVAVVTMLRVRRGEMVVHTKKTVKEMATTTTTTKVKAW